MVRPFKILPLQNQKADDLVTKHVALRMHYQFVKMMVEVELYLPNVNVKFAS